MQQDLLSLVLLFPVLPLPICCLHVARFARPIEQVAKSKQEDHASDAKNPREHGCALSMSLTSIPEAGMPGSLTFINSRSSASLACRHTQLVRGHRAGTKAAPSYGRCEMFRLGVEHDGQERQAIVDEAQSWCAGKRRRPRWQLSRLHAQ